MSANLQIFVWDDAQRFFEEYGCGLAVAIAPDVAAARSLLLGELRKRSEYLWDVAVDWSETPNPSPAELDHAVLAKVNLTAEPRTLPLTACAFYLRGSS
jgi:hypothetical protein